MPYEFEWRIEGRVLYERAYGSFSLEELRQFNEEVTVYVASSTTPPVHLVVDLTGLETYPTNLREVIGTMRRRETKKIGWTIIITEHIVMRFLASMAVQIAGVRLRTFTKVQDAYDFLSEFDATLHFS